MKPLTEKQQRVLSYVDQYRRHQGFPPTLREIGEAVGLVNISAVRGHLAALEKKGYISKEPDKARSIRITYAPSLLSRVKRRLHGLASTDTGVHHKVVYGLALATRGREPILTGDCRTRLEAALEEKGVEHGWVFLEKVIESDHVVLVVEVWPNHSPELVVRRIRAAGASTRRIWAKGYVATTDLGQLEAMVREFLENVGSRPSASSLPTP